MARGPLQNLSGSESLLSEGADGKRIVAFGEVEETIVADERVEKELHVVNAVLDRDLGEGDASGSRFAGGEHTGEV